jgi:hypothetical protein
MYVPGIEEVLARGWNRRKGKEEANQKRRENNRQRQV